MGGHVNVLSVVIAAVAAWIFGAIYYTRSARSGWRRRARPAESCKAEYAAKSGVAKFAPFVLSFVGALIMGLMLYGILIHSGLLSLRAGIISGAFCWFGFVLTTVAVNNAFAGPQGRC